MFWILFGKLLENRSGRKLPPLLEVPVMAFFQGAFFGQRSSWESVGTYGTILGKTHEKSWTFAQNHGKKRQDHHVNNHGDIFL